MFSLISPLIGLLTNNWDEETCYFKKIRGNFIKATSDYIVLTCITYMPCENIIMHMNNINSMKSPRNFFSIYHFFGISCKLHKVSKKVSNNNNYYYFH